MNQANRKAAEALAVAEYDDGGPEVSGFRFRCELAARSAGGVMLSEGLDAADVNGENDTADYVAAACLKIADAIIAAASKGDETP